jgi:hypothetical protein
MSREKELVSLGIAYDLETPENLKLQKLPTSPEPSTTKHFAQKK